MPKKKTEQKDKNWWRKYTTEYQDEDFSKKKSTPTAPQQTKTPKKSVVRFNDRDMLPDVSDFSKDIEKMMTGLLKSSLINKNFFRKQSMPSLMKMEGRTFRKPISGVEERGDKIFVTIELPGVKKDNIQIHIEGLNLIIEAQTKTGSEDRRKGFFSFSKSYTGFRHIVRLPASVEKESAQANYDSGILKIALKKKKGSDSGDIPVE
jgi:HSP20 family protein